MSDLIFFGILFVFLIGSLTAFIWAFIKSKEFRNDLLSNNAENEVSIGPLSLKGVLFLALVGLFLGTTVFMFSQFLEQTESYDFDMADESNNELIGENNALIEENILLKKSVSDLEEKLAEFRLKLIRREAVMDIYSNTKLLAYSANTKFEEPDNEKAITLLSAKLATFAELANGGGKDLTSQIKNACNKKSKCLISKEMLPALSDIDIELIIEYKCSGAYKLSRFTINNEFAVAPEIICTSS